MNARICPSCKSSLGDQDKFFCSVCGQKLPPDLIKTTPNIRYVEVDFTNKAHPISIFKNNSRSTVLHEDKTNKREISSSLLVAFPLIIAILGVIAYLGRDFVFKTYIDFFNESSEIAEIDSKIPENTYVVESDLKKGLFGVDGLIRLVPANVDFIIEVTDAQSIYSTALVENQVIESPESTFSERFSNNVLVFGKLDDWAVLNLAKFTADEFNSVVEEELYYDFIGNTAIVSNSRILINEILGVASGNITGVLNNSQYVLYDQGLPRNGIVRAIILTERGAASIVDFVNTMFIEDSIKNAFFENIDAQVKSFVLIN
jgi:hypothetical protein